MSLQPTGDFPRQLLIRVPYQPVIFIDGYAIDQPAVDNRRVWVNMVVGNIVPVIEDKECLRRVADSFDDFDELLVLMALTGMGNPALQYTDTGHFFDERAEFFLERRYPQVKLSPAK